MKPQDIQNLYPVTPEIHSSIRRTLASLEETQPVRYKKHRNIRRLIVAFAIVALLGAFTTAAYATNLFGLFSERVGKYGLNLSVVGETEPSSAAEKKHVKLKLGYIPEGYQPITTEDGYVINTHFSYGGEPISDRWMFSFEILSTDEYDNITRKYITESNEKTVNGHKVIFMTYQFSYDAAPQYQAVEYFEDWGYIVICHCGDHYDELTKIMEHLDLEENTEYVEPPTIGEEYHDEVDDYTYLGTQEKYRFVSVGDSFDYSDWILTENGSDPPVFTIRVKSVEERDSFDGLDQDSFSYYSSLFSEYFDENNKLITPYRRTDRDIGDGINQLATEWETETNRHFILVTVEATANDDCEYYDDFDVWSRTLRKTSGGSYGYSNIRGQSDLVYQNNPDNADNVWDKGETHTFVYGVVVDDEVLNYSCLYFCGTEYRVDHNAKTIGRTENYTCIMLKEAVQDD